LVYCKRCESTGNPRPDIAGNNFVEAFMWLITLGVLVFGKFVAAAGLIIGVLMYMSWRKRNSRLVCECCGSEEIVPTDSPAGRKGRLNQEYTPVLHLSDEHNGTSR